jgi:hypothetical protein
MKIQEILPVAISITVIILVAVIQKQSRAAAAVTATMPVTIPLTLWIVYSSTHGNPQMMAQFTQSLVIGIIPTVAFVLSIWVASRAGLKLIPMIGAGYLAWGLTLLAILTARKFFKL